MSERSRAGTFRTEGVTFLLLLFANLATLGPCFAPAALFFPQIISYSGSAGVVYVVGVAIATTYLLLGLLRTGRWLTHGSDPVVIPAVSTTILSALFVALAGAASFYSKFAVYPGVSVIREFFDAPIALAGYTRSGAATSDWLTFIAVVAFVICSSIIGVRRVWRERPQAVKAGWNVLLGAALLWAFRDAPIQKGATPVFVAEHSMPLAKYLYALTSEFGSNRIEVVRPYVPRQPAGVGNPTVPKALHVLLVIAECVRADRLTALGYARHTTPFIEEEGAKWVVFDRVYSHASATAQTFPVLFNSQYFAAITGNNDGARALWRFLRQRDVRTAFLSAGTMEWGGVTRSLDVADADHEFIASSLAPGEAWKSATRRSEFAVDDADPLQRYFALLQGDFKGRQSFATLHFVGSHYPFVYDDTPEQFRPSFRQGRGGSAADTMLRFSNSFDNSILHIDHLVQQIVGELERLGIADDSVVMVTSDHGESLGEHHTLFHGTTLYEEQVHVPLLVRVGDHLGPARARLEARRGSVIGQVDLVPTILHLLGGSAPTSEPFDGVSLLSKYRKPYELLLYRGVGEKVAFVTDERKYIFDVEGRQAEEYSLRDDPGEVHNLWSGTQRHVDDFLAALVTRGVLAPPRR